MGGILLGAVGLGAFVAARRTRAARWIAYVLSVVVAIALTAFASSLIQESVADSYTGSNVGIEEEMGILTPGIIWLGIGIFLLYATKPSARNQGASDTFASSDDLT